MRDPRIEQTPVDKLLDEIQRLRTILDLWHQHWREDHGYETQWSPALRALREMGEI